MKRLVRTIGLPALVLVTALLVTQYLRSNPPVPQTRTPEPDTLSVAVLRPQPASYQVVVYSQGRIEAARQGVLAAEVAGRVKSLEPVFEPGLAVDQGQLVMQLDNREYRLALTQAKAELAQAKAQLLEQQALAEQAQTEWLMMNSGGSPSDLTLRKPQLAAAQAALAAANAALEQAQLDLQQTDVVAPIAGLISEKRASIGEFVSRGSRLGLIDGSDHYRITLPLSDWQLPHLQAMLLDADNSPDVELFTTVAGQSYTWPAKVHRIESLQADTQQLHVVANINAPLSAYKVPLRVGQWVQARIYAATLEPVFVIPRTAVREEREVLIVDQQQRIRRQTVSITWSDTQSAVIDEGLQAGDTVIITPLAAAVEGTPVQIRN